MSHYLDAVRNCVHANFYEERTTSWGARVGCYVGSDLLVHALIDPAEAQAGFFALAPYDGLLMLSSRRLAETSALIEEMRGQLLERLQWSKAEAIDVESPVEESSVVSGGSARPPYERRPSDAYDETKDPDLEYWKDMKFEIDGHPLSAEQVGAIKLSMTTDRRVTILTGQAGSGKSTVVQWLRDNANVTISATTGRAALNVGGVTVDSLFGFSRENWKIGNLQRTVDRLRGGSSLVIIDEASMIGNQMGDVIWSVLEHVKGVRVLLVGDWAQAAPVKDGWGLKSRLLSEAQYVRLEECHRQSDRLFIDVLNKVRIGEVDAEVTRVLSQRVLPAPPEDDVGIVRAYATNRLAADYNSRKIDEFVRKKQEDGVLHLLLKSVFKDVRPPGAQSKWPRDARYIANAIDSAPFIHGEALAVGCRVLITRNDAGEVRSYANGDTGELRDLLIELSIKEYDAFFPKAEAASTETTEARAIVDEDAEDEDEDVDDDEDADVRVKPPSPTSRTVRWSELTPDQRRRLHSTISRPGSIIGMDIALDRTGEMVTVVPHTLQSKDANEQPNYEVTGFPVRAGYAVTIHKTQGMTFDRMWFDLSSVRLMPEDGRHGLVYVGISRVRTLEGLFLSAWEPDLVYCDPQVRSLI